MDMTHYMELLATNQPWNLLIFMAVPVILAETIAVSELYILFTRDLKGTIRLVNKGAGILAGWYFLMVFFYLFFKAVIPITAAGEWRTVIDVIAVGFYLLGVVPLFGISLLEMGLIGKHKGENWHLKTHATFVAIFLIVAHIAMIFGMLNPSLLSATTPMHPM
ncbi:MAG TPA: permease [Cyanobacteria bacterium UBA8803]|nr:permease [Cyanobacteria bacterium UBA9273]HBL58201.1 permease [Cyanobacteria bacterium UBA8803]